MASPYIGEIRMVGFAFAPVGWAICDGSPQSIADNTALYSLIGTTYGGNGQTTFNLPDLRGRVPIHFGSGQVGNNFVLGQMAGTETVTLLANQVGTHTHLLTTTKTGGQQTTISGNVWAGSPSDKEYSSASPNIAMSSLAVTTAGQSLPHENMIPFQVINFIIALDGIFPSQQ